MAKLTTAARRAIPTKNDRSHAANALSRVSQFGSPALKAKVRAKVHAKYPTLGSLKKVK